MGVFLSILSIFSDEHLRWLLLQNFESCYENIVFHWKKPRKRINGRILRRLGVGSSRTFVFEKKISTGGLIQEVS